MRRKAKRIVGRAASVALIFMLAGGGVSLWGIPALAYTTTDVEISINALDKIAPGGVFTVTVDISQVDNFDACNYDVSFDPTVLRLDNVTSGDLNGTSIPVDIWNETSPDRYTIVQNVPGLAGVSGSGYLAVLHFQVIGSQGQGSNISLSNGVLSSNLAEEIPAIWIGDSVEIPAELDQGGSPPAASPPAEPSPPSEPETVSVPEVTEASGAFTTNVTAKSADGRVELTISKDTIGLTKEGEPLSEISIAEVTQPLAPPKGSSIIGLVYDLGPDGTTFEPAITLTMSYDPEDIPPGVNEENLVSAFRDAEAGEWVALDSCIVDPESNTITVSISHFTAFTILAFNSPAPPAPPALPAPSAQPKPVNWPVLWGVIGGVVIVFGLIIFLQFRRRLY